VVKLVSKRRFALLRTDLHRFASAHGVGMTARLLGRGLMKRALVGKGR
jgi:hypothetical protein